MIRNAMFGLSLLALTAGSAFAAPHHAAKARTVAEAAAGDTAAPADKAPAKKEKKAKKEKAPKADEGAKDMKAPETK
jgi:hypothetical protein